jgi:RNA polymerase sigma-70 factor (ECF subfamily)
MDGPAKDVAGWLAGAHAGSGDALGQALEAYRNYLLRVAERELDSALRAKGGASDLVQETFLEAQRDFGRFHGTSEAELRAWLRRLLLNNLANFTRSYRGTDKRQIGLEVPLDAGNPSANPGAALAAGTPSPSGQAAAQEQVRAVRQAMERLPAEYRQVLLWRYQEKHSFEEIAALLQRTPNAARKLFARALERFEREMGAGP